MRGAVPLRCPPVSCAYVFFVPRVIVPVFVRRGSSSGWWNPLTGRCLPDDTIGSDIRVFLVPLVPSPSRGGWLIRQGQAPEDR